jgi:asparagine synthase (glutamine-hydrolysing)
MRRLSIIDLSGGDQPIGNEDGSIQVVYNGEIYNYRELRHELEAKGHRFETRSDTEVIVHAYEEFGDDCASRFQGMFAFALWDSRRARLLLARDRVGIKQLFFGVANGQLLFGSEIKALLSHPAVDRQLRPAAVNHYLTYLYVPEPLTMFAGIEELRAGNVLTAERGRIQVRPYWQLRYDVDPRMDADTATSGLRAHLEDAVRDCLVSDVPLGAFLSGGIDSGAVVALMAKHSPGRVNTFSIGYRTGGDAFDERRYAREVAERYGTQHREFEMAPDLTAVAPRLVRAFDQPHADSTAVPMWYLCELTRRHVKVALSGLGGDELAAGYERHRAALVSEWLGAIPPWLPRVLLRPLVDRIPDPKSGNPWGQRIKRFVQALELPFEERYFHLLSQTARATREALLSPEIAEQIDLDEPRTHFQTVLAQAPGAHPLNLALYSDLKLYLPGDLLTLTDRVSMAHSLEVRVPYLDHRLLEFAARIPAPLKLRRLDRKHLLKRAVRDLLPDSFFHRRKMGFSAPLAVWFRDELRDYVEDVLSASAVASAGVFRYDAVRRILDDHYTRRANHDNLIWALLAFALWHADYFGNRI